MLDKDSSLTHQELLVLAHDVRNLLSGINNYAQLIHMLVVKRGVTQEESAALAIIETVHKIDLLIKERIDASILK